MFQRQSLSDSHWCRTSSMFQRQILSGSHWCWRREAYLVVLRENVEHVRHLLAGDLLDDEGSVIGGEQQTLLLGVWVLYWGATHQGCLEKHNRARDSS